MIRALLFPLGEARPAAAVATFDAGRITVESDDPDLRLRLTMLLELPVDAAETLEEVERMLEPGTEAHFRAALSREAHLGLRAVFEDE